MGINIAKKTYWTTCIFLFSAICNIACCFLLIPILGMTGAAISSAVTAVLTLILRTAIGERYYKVLQSNKYLLFAIGVMLLAATGNLLLNGVLKYAFLTVCLLTGIFFYRGELVFLLNTFKEMFKRGQ